MSVSVLLSSIHFSAEKHRHHKRKDVDKSPYINHPIEVAALLANVAGVQDATILAAAVLHDTVEDAHTTPEELETAFGPTVRDLVLEVTDDKSLPKAERKRLQVERAPNLSHPAKLIKIADKISNVREVVERPPDGWAIERRREYVDWAERVVAGCRGVHRGLEDHFDRVVREARAAIAPDP
jgi:guanosine-3',5'-bis(diphosphate) 3'-pyrophosphohydrolase